MKTRLLRLNSFLIFLIISTSFLPGTPEKEFLVIKSKVKNCRVYINNTYAGIPEEGGLFVPLRQGNFEVTIKSTFHKTLRKNITIDDLSFKIVYDPGGKIIFNPILYVFLIFIIFISYLSRNLYRKKSDKYFGNYKLLEMIGKGGVSTIYKSFDTKQKRIVALKIMDKDKIDDGDLKEKFLREGKVISIIKEKYPEAKIVEVFDYGTFENVDNIPYIAMEFLSGDSLYDVIKKSGKVTEQIAINYILQICYTLEYCHDSGIYHRDLSPDNIFIKESTSNLILIDFGIAKNEYTSYRTLDGSISGKPVYMSPEQCLGEDISAASDIYTLGILFYLMLTGTPPFTGSNPIEIMNKHINSGIPDIGSEVNEKIFYLIRKMTAKGPQKRILLNDIILELEKSTIKNELEIETAISALTNK